MSKKVDQHGPLLLHLGGSLKINDEQMYRLNRLNPEYRIERDGEGDLQIGLAPSEEEQWRHSKIFLLMVRWAMEERSGLTFEAGTPFVLPNGAMRVPDLAWVRKSRLVPIAMKKREYHYLPLSPDFVLYSSMNRLQLDQLREKMLEFMLNGTRLGWLLDWEEHRVFIYSEGEPELCLEDPSNISGEPVLHGFRLHPDQLWRFAM